MAARTSSIRFLGEIVLRVNDLDTMQQFYKEIIGLELLKRFEKSAFFRIADGFGGHTQVLALFDRGEGPSADQPSSLDHFAFEIDLADYDAEVARLESLGLEVTKRIFDWVHWRSIFINDPEGNLVEFVCYDELV
jgi:catechol-2,3-dioxygenase